MEHSNNRRGRARAVGVAMLALAAAGAGAAPVRAQSLQSWLTQPTMTGDWGGVRTSLAKEGVQIHGAFTAQYGADVAGGKSTGADYAQQVTLGTDIDLQKLVGWQGASFHFYINSRAGRNLSSDHVGSRLEQMGVFGAGENLRLLQLDYEQQYLNGRLNTLVGYYPMGNEFGATPLLCAFLSNGFCAHDQSLPADSGGWLDAPTAQWGGRIKGFLTKDLYVETGAYESNPTLNSGNNHGFQLSFHGATGAIVPVELGLTTHLGPQNLVGHWKIGGYYDTTQAPNIEFSHEIENGRYGGYVLVDQMVYQMAPNRGVILFGQATVGDERTSLIQSYFAGGVLVQGPFAARPHDVLGLGFVKANISPGKLFSQYAALAAKHVTNFTLEPAQEDVELSYNVQLTPWLKVTPDVQYVINPGAFAFKHYQGAWVVGGQAVLVF